MSAEDTTPPAHPQPFDSAPRDGSRSNDSSHSLAFYGADGLHAGWSVLLFLPLAWLLFQLVERLLAALPVRRGLEHADKLAPILVVRNDYSLLLVVVVAAWIVSLVEKRSFRRYGLSRMSPHRLGQAAAGAALGLGLLSLLVVLLRLFGLLTFSSNHLTALAGARSGVFWLIAFLGVALFEEFASRGFLQFTLTRGIAGVARSIELPQARAIGFWAAAVLLSLIFGLQHSDNPGESSFGMAAAALIGLVLAFSVWRTGSLWWAVGFHAAWDWAQSFLFGTPDSGLVAEGSLFTATPHGRILLSGGQTGPEGSLLVLIPVVLMTLVIFFALKPEAAAPADPHWTPNPPTPEP